MMESILGAVMLLAALIVIVLMMIAGVDTALREIYSRHAERRARELYRKWCAQTPVHVDKQLQIVCGKGYEINSEFGMRNSELRYRLRDDLKCSFADKLQFLTLIFNLGEAAP